VAPPAARIRRSPRASWVRRNRTAGTMSAENWATSCCANAPARSETNSARLVAYATMARIAVADAVAEYDHRIGRTIAGSRDTASAIRIVTPNSCSRVRSAENVESRSTVHKALRHARPTKSQAEAGTASARMPRRAST
jgi:hypothetical protein